jgi:hypothetical protein
MGAGSNPSMQPNIIKNAVLLSLVSLGFSFWGPHAVEKVVTLNTTTVGATVAPEGQVLGFPQVKSIAEGMMRFERIDTWLGMDCLQVPHPGEALRFDELPVEAKPRYISAARTALKWFAAFEFSIVAAVVAAALFAVCGRIQRAFELLFVAYTVGTLLGSLFLAVHILVGLRPNLGPQAAFWILNLLCQSVCAAALIRPTVPSRLRAVAASSFSRAA